MSAIEKAIKKAGSQTNLAYLLGTTPQNISYWVKAGHAPVQWFRSIEEKTGVTRMSLLEDFEACYEIEEVK